MAADQRVSFVLALPLRNPEALTNLLAAVYDPASPRFHRFLTPEQFTAQFGPSAQDYQAVIEYARANGFTVTHTHPNRTLVSLKAAVTDIERAFRVTLRTYRHPTENRTFHAPDAEPSLDVAAPVLTVCGLDDFSLPRPLSHVQQATSNATPLAWTGSGPGGSFFGNDFRAAYAPGVTLNGAGQSVGLIQFDGYDANDINNFKTAAGMPNVLVTNVLVDGASGSPVTYGGSGEVCLDIEMAISMAPGLDRVIVYIATNPSPWAVILNRVANDNQARQVSCSWGGGLADLATDQIFEQMALQGQSFFQASGDSGAYAGAIMFPADNPYITVVGGTTLATSSAGGPWMSETTWSGSSGGISPTYSLPVWQQGLDMIANQGSTTMRNLPDVALMSANIYFFFNGGGSGGWTGTSFAAPLWAGFAALINQQAAASAQPPVGFLNPALYAIGRGANGATAFHDITTGNNFSSGSPDKFSAVAGYDLCTGWGTPNGSNLIDAVVSFNSLGITPLLGATFAGPPGGPFSPAATSLCLTNTGGVALTWSAGATSPWFTLAPSSGTVAAGGATNVVLTLAAAATNLAAGFYSGSAWFTNQVDGTVQGRAVTLWVAVVQNGGFENGGADWVSSGFNAIMNAGYDYSFDGGVTYVPGALFVHAGNYGILLGTAGTLGYLSQTLQTISNRPYLLSFWLTNPLSNSTPNEFLVQWGGNTLFDQIDMGQFAWSNMQFVVLANDTTTVLTFGTRNDPNEFGLDDISARALVMPAFDGLAVQTNAATLAWSASTNVHYQAQYATNLTPAQWVDLGAPMLGTGSTMTVTDPLPASPQRFYRVILQP